MHQQIRLRLGHATSSDGPGAMARTSVEGDPVEVPAGSLLRLLTLLKDEGYNLRAASGAGIETGGEFVFAIDDEDDEDRTAQCASLLKDHGYRGVRIVAPFHRDVEDRIGALAEVLEELVAEGRQVNEIVIGTPRNDLVPVQISTVRAVDAEQAS